MNKIAPTETILTGKWIIQNGKVVGDAECKRIDSLISSYLELIGRHPNGWEVLYRDPADKRIWELTYPQNEMHGGGPQQLRCLTIEEAKKKYGENIVG